MRLNKRHVPYILVAFLVISQVVVIGLRIDIWPFSCYPMFSRLHPTKDVGAYRMEALTRDNRSLTVHLSGRKDIWQAYETLLSNKDTNGLQIQMKRDIENYIQKNPEVKLNEIAELRLVLIGMSDASNKDKTIHQTILHTLQM